MLENGTGSMLGLQLSRSELVIMGNLDVCVQLKSLFPIKVKTFSWPNEATLDYSKSKCPSAILCLVFAFLCILSYLGTLWVSSKSIQEAERNQRELP